MLRKLSKFGIASSAAIMLSACSLATSGGAKLTEQEQDAVSKLNSSQYQPATRTDRDRIETQDNLSQAAFWSREYELNPADLEAAIKLAASVRKMGNPGRAVEITQTTRALYPENPYLNAEFAAALIASDRGDEALQTLDQAIRRTPNYARLWSLKGAALDQVEDYDTARQVYARALQIAPNDPNIMANLGLSYALAGDPKTAEVWLQRAASQPGASPAIRKNLQMVMQLQGKTYNPSASVNAMNKQRAPAAAPVRQQAQTRPQNLAYGQPPAQMPPRSSQQLAGGYAPEPGKPAQQRTMQQSPMQSQQMGQYAAANPMGPAGRPNNVPGLRGSAAQRGAPTSQQNYQAAQAAQGSAPSPQQLAAIRQGQMAAAAAKPNILSQISNSLKKTPPVQQAYRAPAPYGPGAAQQLAGGMPAAAQPPQVTMSYPPEQPYQQAAVPQNAPVTSRNPARRRR